MKLVFIPIDEDNLFNQNNKSKINKLKVVADNLFTLFKLIKDVYLLTPDQRTLEYKNLWNKANINTLLRFLKENIDDKELYCLAIHWEGKNHHEAASLCREKTKNLFEEDKNNVILTYYSVKYDNNTLNKLEIDGSNIKIMVDLIKKRIDEDLSIYRAQRFYELKEILLLNLFPLTFGQPIDNTQINRIQGEVSKLKELEINEKVMKSINDKISEVVNSSMEQQELNTEVSTKKLRDLREHMNKLIDEQLKKTDKKTVYGH